METFPESVHAPSIEINEVSEYGSEGSVPISGKRQSGAENLPSTSVILADGYKAEREARCLKRDWPSGPHRFTYWGRKYFGNKDCGTGGGCGQVSLISSRKIDHSGDLGDRVGPEFENWNFGF